MRAMTSRIASSFLVALAAGLIAAPVEASARGGAFAGGHGMSFRGGFRAPIMRPAIARPTRVAVPARIHNTAPFARFRHSTRPRPTSVRAPCYRDPGAPWYGADGDPDYLAR